MGLRGWAGEDEWKGKWVFLIVREEEDLVVVERCGSKGSEKEELGLLEKCDGGGIWVTEGFKIWSSRAVEGRPATLREETEVDKASMRSSSC